MYGHRKVVARCKVVPDVFSIWLSSDQHPLAARMQPCTTQCWPVQVVADIDNDLEVGVFLGAYRQLAQRQDLETRRLCAESCAVVLKAATPRRSAATHLQAPWPEHIALLLSAVAVAAVSLHHCHALFNRASEILRTDSSEIRRIADCIEERRAA